MDPQGPNFYRGSFGKFLETMRETPRERQQADNAAILLKHLNQQGGKMPLKQLLAETGLPVIDLVKTIEDMQTSHWLSVSHIHQDDIVELTETGRWAAGLL